MPETFEASPNGHSRSQTDERPARVPQVRACTNCVRAKAKCSTDVEVGGKCDRYLPAVKRLISMLGAHHP